MFSDGLKLNHHVRSTCPTYFSLTENAAAKSHPEDSAKLRQSLEMECKARKAHVGDGRCGRVAAFGWQLLLMVQKSGGNAPVDMVNISFFYDGLYTSQVVVWDF